MQRSTIALIRHQPQIHLQSIVQNHAAAGVAVRQHALHIVINDETGHQRAIRCSGDQNIQVAHGIFHAPITACSHHSVDARHALQIIDQRLHVLRCHRELEAASLSGLPGERIKRCLNMLFGFHAKAG